MTHQQPPRLPGIPAPSFGGVVLRPMDTGAGGWDLFRPLGNQAHGDQLTLDEMLDIAADEDTYGGMPPEDRE